MAWKYAKKALLQLLWVVIGGLAVAITGIIVILENRPDLKPWHTTELDAEFRADGSVGNFKDYLALESRLFEQLDKEVYARVAPDDQRLINRYHQDSLADPQRWTPNWNRTFELPAETPRAGILLLHGMSDSPYSLRSIGRHLHANGAWVVGLRLPGHGTIPSGLVTVRWQDMSATVQLAMQHLRDVVRDKPLYIVGYSTGASLALHYALLSPTDPGLPTVDGLILLSPAIGVTRLAGLAVWQARIGRFFGLDKLAWNSILPEYDPFKYQSFAVNAGDQVYRLATHIQKRLKHAKAAPKSPPLPPILAFQSVADATVSTLAIVDGLFKMLPPGDHELMLFDIHRTPEINQILAATAKAYNPAALLATELHFTVSLVTNDPPTVKQVSVLRRIPGMPSPTQTLLDARWPEGLYSLSHVALPFPMDDPLYGGAEGVKSPGLRLGNIALRGERGVLQIPPADILRLRWNPFHAHMMERLMDFLSLDKQQDKQ